MANYELELIQTYPLILSKSVKCISREVDLGQSTVDIHRVLSEYLKVKILCFQFELGLFSASCEHLNLMGVYGAVVLNNVFIFL